MHIVRCHLPNASTSINGVAFTPKGGHVESEPVSKEVADHFGAIKGYTTEDLDAPPMSAEEAAVATAKALGVEPPAAKARKMTAADLGDPALLDAPKAAVPAAGEKVFQPGLPPRGARRTAGAPA